MTPLRTYGTRQNALWGKNVGGRARTLAVTLAVCSGLVLASAPTAGAKRPLPPPPPVASVSPSPDTSWVDASWLDASWVDASWVDLAYAG